MEDKFKAIKTWLHRPQNVWGEIKVLRTQIENLRLTMELPKGVSYDGVKVQTSPQDPMANFAVRLEELERKYEEKLKEYELTFDEVNAVINAVGNTDVRVILTARYIGFEKWEKIEEETPLCLRQIHRKHRLGLRIIEKSLKSE